MLKPLLPTIQARWALLSLRQQLILTLWLCTVPVSALGSAAMWQQTYGQAKGQIRQSMAFNLATMAQVMNDWLGEKQTELKGLSAEPAITDLNQPAIEKLLRLKKQQAPQTDLTVYTTAGLPIASNAEVPPRATPADTERRLRSSWFQEALAGKPGLELWLRAATRTTCLSQATAIRQGTKIVGILQGCIAPDYVAALSGVATRLTVSETGGQPAQRLNLTGGSKQGSTILLVSKDGELLRLDAQGSAVTDDGILVNAALVARSPWGPLVTTINGLNLDTNNSAQADSHGYLFAVSALNREFRLASVTDKGTALREIRQVTLGIIITNLVALLISTLAIARLTKPLLSPVDAAGEALRQLSEGNFTLTLPNAPNSNIKRLYSYITTSANQLQTYVADVAKNAATNVQVSEAKRVQTSFLLNDLPQNNNAELAAICLPAYEIGADWYDALELRAVTEPGHGPSPSPITVVVVADVCDKGIPSALYMSVFRSLLRLSLLKEWQASGDIDITLGSAIGTVNRYMAETHGSTCMFATAFLGAYAPDQHRLSYVLAGHENPFIRRTTAGTASPLERLRLGGPALGLFSEASYAVETCPFNPGDLLLAFSDGLPDARNVQGKALGLDPVAELLKGLDPRRCSAAAVLNQTLTMVGQHCGDSEHFDDLTLLTLRALGGP